MFSNIIPQQRKEESASFRNPFLRIEQCHSKMRKEKKGKLQGGCDMERSKVYFTTFKTTGNENLLQKLRRLILTAGIRDIDFTDRYAAIKIHFGEMGNLAFLRPNYAKVVADVVKECGGSHFSQTAIRFMWAAAKMRWITWIQRMPMDFHRFQPDVM